MSKKDNTKKIVSINVDIEKWKRLEDFGVSNKSQWINEQMDKLLSVHDDLQGLKIKLQQIEHEERELAVKKAMVIEEMERIKRVRGENANNTDIINNAMKILRRLISDERTIAKYYVEFQANKHHIDYNVLEKHVLKENIVIKDIPIRTDTDTGEQAIGGYVK